MLRRILFIIKQYLVSLSSNRIGINGTYLLATKKAFYQIENNKIKLIQQGQFYGISVFEDIVYVYQKKKDSGQILKYNMSQTYKLSNKSVFIDNLSEGCHQIDCFDRHLFVTDSYNNRILKYSLNGRLVDKYYPMGKLENGRLSPNYGHINSIYKYKNKIYVFCHNETSKTEKSSEILVLDLNFEFIDKISLNAGNGHNIIILNDKIYFCDSINNAIRRVDKTVFIADLFTRGLSVSDDLILVGGSEYAKREDRESRDGKLYILNRNWNILDTYKINGMVQEIRRLDKIDYGLSSNSPEA